MIRKAHAAALFAALALTTGALAQQYPTKPVRIVIGLSAGGGTDVLTRIIAGNISVAVPHVKAVKLRALANTSGVRSPLVPEIPTVA